jgi:hypothetical protein
MTESTESIFASASFFVSFVANSFFAIALNLRYFAWPIVFLDRLDSLRSRNPLTFA